MPMVSMLEGSNGNGPQASKAEQERRTIRCQVLAAGFVASE